MQVDVPSRPVPDRQPQSGLYRDQYQFSNWYHFRWLSGDDVTQSLVHNMDRVAWILKEEMPAWCFGLGGRSASSFGEVYGDMFDHHTVVYEYASGARVYALCRTEARLLRQLRATSSWAPRASATSATAASKARPSGSFRAPHNNPYDDEQKALIESVRNGQPINSGYHMANSTMIGVLGQVACYSGKPIRWDEVAKSDFPVRPAAGRGQFRDASAQPAGRRGQLPAPAARREQVCDLRQRAGNWLPEAL